MGVAIGGEIGIRIGAGTTPYAHAPPAAHTTTRLSSRATPPAARRERPVNVEAELMRFGGG